MAKKRMPLYEIITVSSTFSEKKEDSKTNIIRKVSLNYIFFLSYSSISDENATKNEKNYPHLGSRYSQN